MQVCADVFGLIFWWIMVVDVWFMLQKIRIIPSSVIMKYWGDVADLGEYSLVFPKLCNRNRLDMGYLHP